MAGRNRPKKCINRCVFVRIDFPGSAFVSVTGNSGSYFSNARDANGLGRFCLIFSKPFWAARCVRKHNAHSFVSMISSYFNRALSPLIFKEPICLDNCSLSSPRCRGLNYNLSLFRLSQPSITLLKLPPHPANTLLHPNVQNSYAPASPTLSSDHTHNRFCYVCYL